MTKSNKIYRPNVAAVILSPNYPDLCEFFLAHRTDIKGVWQFPQGGIDKGEKPIEALFRELKEEIGTNDIEIISEFPEWIQYDFPSNVSKKLYPFDGQTQKYFLVRLKNQSEINIETPHPEFNKYKFVSYEELFEKVTHFKRQVYKQVIGYFKKEGYL